MAVVTGLVALTACAAVPPPTPTAKPQARPAVLPRPVPPAPTEPSVQTVEMARYYARVQNDLLNRGLLRVDGGGPDTPYNARNLAQNFEQIAFYDEYASTGGFEPSQAGQTGLRKWTGPVRMAVEFGASVPQAARDTDSRVVRAYAGRLARITGHPISITASTPNFHVLVMGEDDRPQLLARVRQIQPAISTGTLQMIRNMPRDIHCVVVSFAAPGTDHVIDSAIAVIRAEHPDLARKACLHEELAQGLGLVNDSPRARPSIFNDDEEFAFLTTHDEDLLRLLYDPSLTPGMSVEQARPIFTARAAQLLGGES